MRSLPGLHAKPVTVHDRETATWGGGANADLGFINVTSGGKGPAQVWRCVGYRPLGSCGE